MTDEEAIAVLTIMSSHYAHRSATLDAECLSSVAEVEHRKHLALERAIAALRKRQSAAAMYELADRQM